MTSKHEGPSESANSTRASNRNSADTVSRFAREIAATLLAALIFAASVWTSVFGMAADLASGPMAPVHVAEVSNDH